MTMKEKLKEKEEKLLKKERKERAKYQAKESREIYKEGFAGFGFRDLWENNVFKLVLLFGLSFILMFLISGAVFFVFRFNM